MGRGNAMNGGMGGQMGFDKGVGHGGFGVGGMAPTRGATTGGAPFHTYASHTMPPAAGGGAASSGGAAQRRAPIDPDRLDAGKSKGADPFSNLLTL